MTVMLMVPLILQGIFILIDEFFFHQKRRLPPWEVWGHPLDTLSVAIPFGIIVFQPYGEVALMTYGIVALLSCLLITKDEFVHAELCSPVEHWLHAVLFILHPVAFIAAGILWREGASHVLVLQFSLVMIFMFYQIFYWGRPWKRFLPKSER